jgi:phosphinothricin acetyltransferase
MCVGQTASKKELMNYSVRVATEYDAAQIQAIYEPYVLSTPISFELDPPDVSDMRRRIVETTVHYPWLLCENSEGAILGYAYASQHHVRAAYQWSVDISIYVEEAYHRMGVGSALSKGLLEILALQGFCTACSCITMPNDPSIALHESLGFTKVGIFRDSGYKLGNWLDVGWWELQLRNYDNTPKVPAPFASMASSQQVRDILASCSRSTK